MKPNLSLIILLIFVTFECCAQNTNLAALNFPLPKAAKYSVTVEQFEIAKKTLQKHFCRTRISLPQSFIRLVYAVQVFGIYSKTRLIFPRRHTQKQFAAFRWQMAKRKSFQLP
jgi:hypothetical protein